MYLAVKYKYFNYILACYLSRLSYFNQLGVLCFIWVHSYTRLCTWIYIIVRQSRHLTTQWGNVIPL